MIQEFLIKGKAIPASRPRTATNFRSKTGGFCIYKPKADIDWQKSIYEQVSRQKPFCFERNTPIKVISFLYYQKPDKATYEYPISHNIGDNDNIEKNIFDALQSRNIKIGKLKVKQKGLCFEDDCQIVSTICRRFYTLKEDYVILRITDELYNREVENL